MIYDIIPAAIMLAMVAFLAYARATLIETKRKLQTVEDERDSHLARADLLKKEQDHKANAVRRECEDKLAEKDARVEKIVGELSHVRWRRDLSGSEHYEVTIRVCPRLFGGHRDRKDLMYLAQHIGDQVAYELASYKYIQKAEEYERNPFGR